VCIFRYFSDSGPVYLFYFSCIFSELFSENYFFFKKTACEDDFILVDIHEQEQRRKLAIKVAQLDARDFLSEEDIQRIKNNKFRNLAKRASEEEAYWIKRRQREETKFVSARLYHQQQQEEEARLNSLYPSRATEEEWKAIQQECRERLSQQ